MVAYRSEMAKIDPEAPVAKVELGARCSAPELEDGKAMVVAMSRHIAVDLFDEIIKIRPQWHDPDFRKGAIKIIFHSSASDDEKIRPHA